MVCSGEGQIPGVERERERFDVRRWLDLAKFPGLLPFHSSVFTALHLLCITVNTI